MQGLTSQQLLLAWEQAGLASPVERPVAILVAAGEDRDAICALPIGERDARLLELRAATFGPVLDVFVSCPACHEHLEFPIEIARLADQPPALAGTHVLALADREVVLRVLDSRDLAAAARLGSVEAVTDALIAAAVVEVRRRGEVVATSTLDLVDRAAIAERLSELDPRADILLDAICPTCSHEWQAPLDVAAFVHAELVTAARRLLRQVATLARAFGWTEREVLELSPARRRAYLELADQRSAE